jgi:hypothetical protein
MNKKTVYGIAIIASLVLYIAGVLSGIYATKISEMQISTDISTYQNETLNDISRLKQNTSKEVKELAGYIKILDTNLNDLQLEQQFIESLNQNEVCQFLNISLQKRFTELGYYWEKLPFRIEEYERDNTISDEYSALKKEYTLLSIRTWILARNHYQKCNSEIKQGLYFYSKTCTDCVKQGEQLDKLNSLLTTSGKKVMIFTIDFDSDQEIISSIKKHYKINSTPAIIINDKVFQGRVFSDHDLAK